MCTSFVNEQRLILAEHTVLEHIITQCCCHDGYRKVGAGRPCPSCPHAFWNSILSY